MRPPSSPKPVELNAAPPVASRPDAPLSVPPENDDAPVAVSVSEPFSWPALWFNAPVITVPLKVAVLPLTVSKPVPSLTPVFQLPALPVLLNSEEIVEVKALPDLMKVPALFTAAVAAVGPLTLAAGV